MPTLFAFVALLGLLMVVDARPGTANPGLGAASPNDTARFLAGLPPTAGSPLEALSKEPVWQQYARNFDTEWAALEAKQIGKARAWGAKHLEPEQRPLYYMFSGPDFLYADTFFPKATVYVMSGLEPVGRQPDLLALKPRALPSVLEQLRASLSDILSRSFFITSYMDQKLRRAHISGVLPVLYVFLARTGRTITDVTFLTLDADGTVKPFDLTAASAHPRAVKVSFTAKDGAAQTLYFFNTNVADKSVAESGFLKFCESLGTGDALIKSASYLPHAREFSHVRNVILRQSSRILQDDTGVPMQLYKEAEWKVEPFGVYTHPIPPFNYAYQPAMKALYDRRKPAKLDFSYGYRWRNNQSNIQLATKIRPQ